MIVSGPAFISDQFQERAGLDGRPGQEQGRMCSVGTWGDILKQFIFYTTRSLKNTQYVSNS